VPIRWWYVDGMNRQRFDAANPINNTTRRIIGASYNMGEGCGRIRYDNVCE